MAKTVILFYDQADEDGKLLCCTADGVPPYHAGDIVWLRQNVESNFWKASGIKPMPATRYRIISVEHDVLQTYGIGSVWATLQVNICVTPEPQEIEGQVEER